MLCLGAQNAHSYVSEEICGDELRAITRFESLAASPEGRFISHR